MAITTQRYQPDCTSPVKHLSPQTVTSCLHPSIHLMSGVVRLPPGSRFNESDQYYQWPGSTALWRLLSIGKLTCVFLPSLLFIPPHLRSSFVCWFIFSSLPLVHCKADISHRVKFQIWIVVTWACSLGRGGDCLYIVKWWTLCIYCLFIVDLYIKRNEYIL